MGAIDFDCNQVLRLIERRGRVAAVFSPFTEMFMGWHCPQCQGFTRDRLLCDRCGEELPQSMPERAA